jgi:hypothetical protein
MGIGNGSDPKILEQSEWPQYRCRLAVGKRSQLVGIVIVTQLPRRTARTPHGTQT